MTEGERETVLSLLLSEGTYKKNSFWENEENGIICVYNGDSAAVKTVVSVSAACIRHLYGEGKMHFSDGTLSLEMPPKTLMLFQTADAEQNGVEKDGIIYEKPFLGGTVHCSSDTWAAQFIRYDNKKELIGIFRSGAEITDEDGELQFFRWDNMRPQ